MGDLLRFNLARLRQELGLAELYSTCSHDGPSLRRAQECGIANIIACEPGRSADAPANPNLAGLASIQWVRADRVEFARMVPSSAAGPRLIFIDAGIGNERESGQTAPAGTLVEELELLAERRQPSDWIIIDNVRRYVGGVFAKGECPPQARIWDDLPRLEAVLARFAATHHVQLLRQDYGYFFLIPKLIRIDWRDIVRVLPGDPAGNGSLEFQFNVPGVTAISIQRRIADHRFATRYFVGRGLDVGGGGDSLALYQEFFPLAKAISRYDIEHGDAQYLRNVDDGAFDFLYSSHCLEHLHDPREALANWLRVVKSGGHLVVQVPDEDMYEQGQWPSRYNPDHKLSFTICKTKSWSPVSVNVLDLLRECSPVAKIISVAQIDQGYRSRLVPPEADQTRTPLAECGIEFVLRKY